MAIVRAAGKERYVQKFVEYILREFDSNSNHIHAASTTITAITTTSNSATMDTTAVDTDEAVAGGDVVTVRKAIDNVDEDEHEEENEGKHLEQQESTDAASAAVAITAVGASSVHEADVAAAAAIDEEKRRERVQRCLTLIPEEYWTNVVRLVWMKDVV